MQENENNVYNIEVYDFSITGLLKEGFKRSYGAKMKILGALFIYVIIVVVSGTILEILFPSEGSLANSLIGTFIELPITLPILVGLTMLGIARAREEEVLVPSIFNYYNSLASLLLAYVIMAIFLTLGFILLIIPGLYLAIAYSYTYPLIVDKGMRFFDAMELSRKTITKQWFKFFGLALLSGFIILLSAIPFGIGLIWSIPTVYISYGLLYHHLFDEDLSENKSIENSDEES